MSGAVREGRGTLQLLSRHLEMLYAYGSIAPAMIVIAVFTLYPFGYALVASLRRFVLTMPFDRGFVGLGNFLEVIKSYYFFASLRNTIVYMLCALACVSVLGMLTAIYLNNRSLPGTEAVKVVLLIPWAIPTVVAGIIWKLIFHGSYGALNGVLYNLGIIEDYVPWLANPSLAKVAVLVAHVWKETPLVAILFLAGMQTVPHELLEAATIDGSSAVRSFFRVTLPYLKPIILVVCVYETMVGIATFDLIYVMTGGGPGDATSLIGWFAYTETFSFLNLGHGAAASFLLALTLVFFILAYIRLIRVEEVY